jgi:Flp pilus assembly protein TadD
MSTINETLQNGVEHHRAGRLREAEDMYRKVLELHPRHAGAVHLLGLLAFQVGRTPQSLELLREAMRLDAFNPLFPADLADICAKLGMRADAMAAYDKSLSLDPNQADVLAGRGQLKLRQCQWNEAVADLLQAIELDPALFAAHANLGAALRNQGRLAEAQAAMERAVQLNSHQADLYLNLGVVHYEQGQLLEAIACAERALRLNPRLADARHVSGMARLALGDYANGWREYAAPFRPSAAAQPTHGLPTWTGVPVAGTAVVIVADTDLAHTILLLRCIPLVKARGGEVVADLRSGMSPLAAPLGCTILSDGEPLPENCRWQLPLSSLPGLLGITTATAPATVPYLSVPEEALQKWREKLPPDNRLRIGIHAQASTDDSFGTSRSIPLGQFAPLAAMPGVRLFNLQSAPAAGDGPLPEGVVDLASEFAGEDALVQRAAAIRQLDLVITADGPTAHLAGALGAPAWIVLSSGPDWCWLRDRDDSPWYPSVRLFRQALPGDWQDVCTRLAAELAARQAKSPAP